MSLVFGQNRCPRVVIHARCQAVIRCAASPSESIGNDVAGQSRQEPLDVQLEVVVDVAEEDEADARTDHDTVLEVVADCLVQRLVVGEATLPNVNVLLAQSVEEVERVADQEYNQLVEPSSVLFLLLFFLLLVGNLLDQVLRVCHENLVIRG